MDPLSVLGVVAATVQFVDFSGKLISRTFKIYTSDSGELCDEERRVAIAKDLQDLNEKIKSTTEAAIRITAADQDEISLLDLCNGCDDVARKLLDALSKLQNHKKGKKSKEWESFRIALESIWSGDELEKLERRLSAYQQQISLHILWSMRKQLEGGLNNLALEQTRTREEISRLVSERHHWRESVIALIGTPAWPAFKPYDFDNSRSRFIQLVLRGLHFQWISNREERISDAHKATFQWIFEPPRADQKSWADFRGWLESDSSIYCITGKAGAGKSTLMKFIGHDPKTTQILERSARDRRLAIARFYFWNSGAELQMTQEGLLRTLTHDLIQQCHDLFINTFPQRWELFRLFGIFDEDPVDYIGLKRLLDQIIKANPSTQFVFFIDGLDEFIGDHLHLAAYVRQLSGNTNTKICVSSRPWNEFQDAFATEPSLRVEDLTYPDVVCFIESNFNESPGYAELRVENEAGAKDLTHAIASKASGVFLWVSLVVKSLLLGLTNGERLSKLRLRLDELPPDLEQLFQRMLDQIAPEDQEDASRLFQMVRAAVEPPTVMALAWTDEDDSDLPFHRAIEPLSSTERDAKSRRMHRRLKRCCRGLLEADRSSSEGTVDWIHRTVRDFLYRHEVWSAQKSYTPPSFHPEEGLSRSCLLQLKCADDTLGIEHGSMESVLPANTTRFTGLVSGFVRYTHGLYIKTGDAHLQLYDEFATTTKELLHRNSFCVGACWCRGPADDKAMPFLALAVSLHIMPYIDARLTTLSPRGRRTEGCEPLLELATLSTSGLNRDWKSALCYSNGVLDLVRLLLARGADPNSRVDEWRLSPWRTLIRRQKSDLSPDIMMEFLRHGADPNVDLDFVGSWGSEWSKVLELQREMRKPKKRKTERKNRYRLFVRQFRFWN